MQWNLYEILEAVFGIIGAVSSLVAIWEFVGKKYITRTFSWGDVSRAVRRIMADLNSRSFVPDVVVGLGRGGSIMGGLIAGNLGAIRICSMDRRRITSPEESMSVPDFVIKPNVANLHSLSPPGEKLKILLVTGEVVTGHDLFYAKKTLGSDLESNGIEYELLTASFSYLIHTNFQPDVAFAQDLKKYRTPPWRMSRRYINDRRADKTFHLPEEE